MSTDYPPPPPGDDRPSWQPPADGYGAPPGPPKTNGAAIAALVCGIIALVLFWFAIASIPLGIAALIAGAIGLRSARERGGKGMAIGGLVTGGLALVAAVIVLIFAVTLFEDLMNDPEFQEVFESELQRQDQLESEVDGSGS